jgi:hypothetical protein
MQGEQQMMSMVREVPPCRKQPASSAAKKMHEHVNPSAAASNAM